MKLIRQVHENSVLLATIDILKKDLSFNFNQISAQVSMNFNNITILSIHGVHYGGIINEIAKLKP